MDGSLPGDALRADVLIIGGGMVGATLALALADIPMDVIVVDRQHPADALDAGFGGRASAVALASRRLFDGLGVWAGMEGDAAPIRHIRVSEGTSPLFLHYDQREAGAGPFGFMVENRMIRAALARRPPGSDDRTPVAHGHRSRSGRWLCQIPDRLVVSCGFVRARSTGAGTTQLPGVPSTRRFQRNR